MAQRDMKPGDLVRLKSGGPVMVVNSVPTYATGGRNTGRLRCVWFDGAERREGEFAAEALDGATRCV